MSDAVGSTWIRQTHHRTQFSPSATIVVLFIKHISEEAKNAAEQLWERGMINKFETNLQISQSEKHEEEVLQVLEQSLPCSSCRNTHWSRFSSCNPWWGSCLSRYSPCSPLRISRSRRWKYLQGRCSLVITGLCKGHAHGEELVHGFLAGLVTPQKTHTGTIYSWRTVTHCKNTCWSSPWRTAACGKDTCQQRTISYGRRVHYTRVEESMKGKEQQSKLFLLQPPFLTLLATTQSGQGGGRRVVNEGVKLSLKERGWGQGKVFLFPSFFLTILMWF